MTLQLHQLTTTITTTWTISTTADTWMVRSSGVIDSGAADGIHETSGAASNLIDIAGFVKASSAMDDQAAGILAEGANTDIGIATSGVVEGFYGVELFGTSQSLVNHGAIYGAIANGYGVYMDGNVGSTISNFGSIGGDTAVFIFGGNLLSGPSGVTALVNRDGGVISSTGDAINASTADNEYIRIVNRGLLDGDDTAYTGGDGSDVLVNSGEIQGDVRLGLGSDSFDGRGGKMFGNIYGGGGGDTLLTSKAGLQLIEGFGAGRDSVFSTVSYDLNANVEQLFLIGNKNIDGNGNGLDNRLEGNVANNILRGGDGNDHLWGHAGADKMRGGANADIFIFGDGDGRDQILDFENGRDRIDLSGWANTSNLFDVKAHLTVDGDDLVIRAGSDSLRLVDVDRNELDRSDFLF